MTREQFKLLLNEAEPPAMLSVQMQALWWEAKGNWKRAHDLIDHLEDAVSAHVHAYLHRVEGDRWNARYWYNRAGQPEYQGTLAEEWASLVERYA